MSGKINIACIQQVLHFKLTIMNIKRWPLYRLLVFMIISSSSVRVVCSQKTKFRNCISQVRPSYLALIFHFLTTPTIISCHKSHRCVYPLLPSKMQNFTHRFNETSLHIYVNSNFKPYILRCLIRCDFRPSVRYEHGVMRPRR